VSFQRADVGVHWWNSICQPASVSRQIELRLGTLGS
jgi:hypothetical protein